MTELHPCYGRSWLFDSVNAADHLEARAYCLGQNGEPPCAQMAECRRRLELNAPRDVQGTWAGKLYGAPANAMRMLREDERFTDEDARAAHARFWAGERDAKTRVGERVYQRRSARALKRKLA